MIMQDTDGFKNGGIEEPLIDGSRSGPSICSKRRSKAPPRTVNQIAKTRNHEPSASTNGSSIPPVPRTSNQHDKELKSGKRGINKQFPPAGLLRCGVDRLQEEDAAHIVDDGNPPSRL
jgi:hypothetical protein